MGASPTSSMSAFSSPPAAAADAVCNLLNLEEIFCLYVSIILDASSY